MVEGFDVTYRVTEFFFDRAKVHQKIGQARVRALGKAGAFIRRRVRTAVLRRRKAVSAPGSPPSVRSSHPVATLRNVLYFYDQKSDSMVVGPVALNQAQFGNGGNRITIPALMEFGGTVKIREERYLSDKSGEWYRRDNRRRADPHKEYRTRRARYKKRPFMSVALNAEIAAGTLPRAWVNAVRG